MELDVILFIAGLGLGGLVGFLGSSLMVTAAPIIYLDRETHEPTYGPQVHTHAYDTIIGDGNGWRCGDCWSRGILSPKPSEETIE